ncbi:MAG: ATP-binding protein [Pseudomonadales bacterium]|nr:ATP-binding protein [Pseudomonadales bacterium]
MIPEQLIHYVEPLKPSDSVLEVSDRFAKCEKLKSVLSLPVVRNGKPVGLVSRHMLDGLMLTRYGRELNGKKTMLEIMRLDPIIVNIEQPLMDAANAISKKITSPISEDFVIVRGDQYMGIGFIVDILRLMENDLRERTIEVEVAARAKEQFLANMSHEIRTPMIGLVGMLELLRDTPLNQDQKNYLNTVDSSCQQLMSLISDILDYSKSEKGKLSLECVEISIPHLIQDCLDIAYTNACQKSLALSMYIAPDVPQQLLGDPDRIKQAIGHLLNNAIKFTDKGYVALHVLKDHQQPNSDKTKLKFEIVDSGIGVPSHKVDKLFRGLSAVKVEDNGADVSGLGLAMCKRIVDLHEGEMGVDTEVGHGSLFWFSAQFNNHPNESAFSYDFSNLDSKIIIDMDGLENHYIERQLEVWRTPIDKSGIDKCQSDNTVSMYPHIFISNDASRIKNLLKLKLPQRSIVNQFIYVTDRPHDKEFNQGNVQTLRAPITPVRIVDALNQLKPETKKRTTNKVSTKHNASENHRTGFDHLSVLVADNNNVNQKVLTAYLEKLGIFYKLVEDGAKAVSEYHSNPIYDLALIGINIPKLDGYTCAESIAQISYELDILKPVIVACNTDQQKNDQRDSLAIDEFLSKPLRLNQLIKLLDKFQLRHHSKRDKSHIC